MTASLAATAPESPNPLPADEVTTTVAPTTDLVQVPLLVLDGDDTVRKGPTALGHFVHHAHHVELYPEVVPLMKQWREQGGRIVLWSNQGGVAMGHIQMADAYAIAERTDFLTGHRFDTVKFCPHHPEAPDPMMRACWCRKPSPGLIVEAAVELALRFPGEWYPSRLGLVVGDREEDKAGAEAAGMAFQWAKDWRASQHER